MAEQKKLNGRPKLKEGKRSRKIDVRFTDDEYSMLLALEKELGISRTEVVRTRVLNYAARDVINARDLIGLLDGIGAEMGRAGNNINQLARHANTLHLAGKLSPDVVFTFNELLTDYIDIKRALESTLRNILRMISKK